jgi:hypothetical protein
MQQLAAQQQMEEDEEEMQRSVESISEILFERQMSESMVL